MGANVSTQRIGYHWLVAAADKWEKQQKHESSYAGVDISAKLQLHNGLRDIENCSRRINKK